MQPISKHHPKLEILHGHPRENGDPIDSRLRENDIVERRYHATSLETQHRRSRTRDPSGRSTSKPRTRDPGPLAGFTPVACAAKRPLALGQKRHILGYEGERSSGHNAVPTDHDQGCHK